MENPILVNENQSKCSQCLNCNINKHLKLLSQIASLKKSHLAVSIETVTFYFGLRITKLKQLSKQMNCFVNYS